MRKTLIIKDKIKRFNKQIQVSGDKSLSIRWVLLASQAIGKSKGYNLLMSEDVLAAIDSIKKLGIKVRMQKNYCEIIGNGINGFKYNKNLTIDAKNSGTLGRLILGLLIKSPKKIKIIGDKSLSKRDFSRVTTPLGKFGVKFSYKIKNKLPLTIHGTQSAKGIKYFENKGSAQCKSSVMLAALDVLTIKMLQEIIVNLQTENNITICICDHQARDLLSCVDIALILSNCKIVAHGSPNDLVNNVEAKNAYFGDAFKFN